MKRATLAAALTLLLAAPLSAQLQMRVDRSTNADDPDNVPDVTVEHVGESFQVVTGPAVVLWDDSWTVTGGYTLSARFTLQEPSSHNNYYGLMYGGGALDGERQNYLYFLIGQNGSYIVKHRANNETVHDIQGRTAHEVINTPGDDGTSVNDLEVRVGDEIQYVINGTVVFTTPNEGMAGRTDGLYGVRVNHVIPGVLVEGLSVSN